MSDYTINECIYTGTRALVPNTLLYNGMYTNISLTDLFIHADSFGYSLYEMTDHRDTFIGLFINILNFKNIWPVHERHIVWDICSINGEPGEFVQIKDDILDKVKQADGKKLQTYILQRALWPDDDNMIAKYKKIEYEVCSHVINALGSLVNFKQQYQIMDYKADLMFELKHTSLSCIPSIIMEVDEDGHADRDTTYEKERHAICEFFANRVVRIPVPRSSTDRQLKVIANKAVTKIKNIINELTAQYAEDISPDFFMERLNKYDIEKKYVTWFYKKSEDGSRFKYDHESIGEFLGYKAGDNGQYRRIRELIIKSLDKSEDFVEKSCCAGAGTAAFDKKPVKNRGGSGMNKKVYMLTRTGFFMLSMVATGAHAAECRKAFAKVYELALDFAMSMKSKISRDIVCIDDKKEMVEKRMKDKMESGRVSTLKKEKKALEEKIEELTDRVAESHIHVKNKSTAYNDSAKKRTRLEGELEELQVKYNKVVKKKDRYTNKYKELKAERGE
jgi:hypothetical protein